MLVEAPRDLLVGGIEAQREVGGQHRRQMLRRRVVRIRNGLGGALGDPLVRAGRALGQFPLVAEQVLEEVVAPLRGRGGPGHFQAAGDGVGALAGAEAAAPAQALFFDAGRFRLRPHVGGRTGPVGLAEGVAARDQRDRLFIVHRHAGERLADVPGRRDRIGVAVRAFRIDVDQAHLDRGERVLQIAIAGVALVAQPGGFGTPVDILFRLPHILAPAGEAEGLEAHRLQRDVAREDHEVGPRNVAAVLLLDRPQQPARLVEVGVVGPAVERREALLAGTGAAAAVAGAVRAGAVPCHADEQRAVVAEVGRPPVLRGGHQREQVLLHGRQVQALEGLRIVEVRVHRIGLGRVLVQDLQVQLVGPPVTVGYAAAGSGMLERTLGFRRHVRSPVGICA